MQKKTVADIDVAGKGVFLRVDFNVPMDRAAVIGDDSRIKAGLATIRYLLEHDSRVIICSHLGRPDGKVVDSLRLRPVAIRLSELLGRPVEALADSLGPEVEAAVKKLNNGELVLLENIRFYPEEEANDPNFAEALARLAEVFVNDAFAVSHRAHASVVGVAKHLPAVAGFLMSKELQALDGALENPRRPFVAMLGGAKVSGKLAVLENIVDKVDTLLIGGGMTGTFLKSLGYGVGDSLVENDRIGYVRRLMEKAKSNGRELILPRDLVVARSLEAGASTRTVKLGDVQDGWIIGDIGPDTVSEFSAELKKAKTVIWNGPLGVFEISEFANGTRSIIRVLADLQATTVIGGGSTAEAVNEMGMAERMSHVSTGGGASLEFLEGKVLPGVAVLQDMDKGQ